MINPDAAPIDHRSPYKPIDMRLRRQIITREDIENGKVREPDSAAYWYEVGCDVWRLRDSMD